MTTPAGSYIFEKLEGRHAEATLLAERAGLRLDGFEELLKRHGLHPNARVLEVGCGQGIRTGVMAKAFPDAQILGIDRSPELLATARTHQRASNLKFEEADLYDLQYPEASFDLVYARLVFMHLNDPLGALKGLLRVLKPGGRILIEDADRDCMFFEPTPQSFPDFWKKVQEGQRRLGGDPNVGRRLAPYLKELGTEDLLIETQPIVGGGDEIRFLVRTLLPSLNTYLHPEDRMKGEKAIQDLDEAARDSRATFYHFWFAVSAKKRDERLL